MDYEKMYKEALERARQFSENPLLEDSSNIVEYIFPELEEQKGDKIRKTLISFFSKGAELNGTTNGVADKDILAWLETQGHKDKLIKELERKSIDNLTPQEAMDIAVAKCFEQGEQKPLRWSEEDMEMIGSIHSTLELDVQRDREIPEVAKSHKKELKWFDRLYERGLSVKPIWNEDDTKMVQIIQTALDMTPLCYDTHKAIDNWLKSLEERMKI